MIAKEEPGKLSLPPLPNTLTLLHDRQQGVEVACVGISQPHRGDIRPLPHQSKWAPRLGLKTPDNGVRPLPLWSHPRSVLAGATSTPSIQSDSSVMNGKCLSVCLSVCVAECAAEEKRLWEVGRGPEGIQIPFSKNFPPLLTSESRK